MASPVQKLESTLYRPGQYAWIPGLGLPLERRDLKLAPKSSLFEAQIDEHIAKGQIGQKRLIQICREMTGFISGASVTNPGIKKRPTIVEKIQKRGKSVEAVNDVTRATVTFHHLEELYAADAWVQSRKEFRDVLLLGGIARKNRYTRLAANGDYRDIKLFLAVPIPQSRHPWIVELQLNLRVAMKNKGIGHGIYEITRLGDNVPINRPLEIPADKVMRIAQKIRSCYVSLKKTGIQKDLLASFRRFIEKYLKTAIENLENDKYRPSGFTISAEERGTLNQVSQAVYVYSFKVAKRAVAYKQGGMKPLIAANELIKK